jgi:hypothetical protein
MKGVAMLATIEGPTPRSTNVVRTAVGRRYRRGHDERGEGVISAAIAVLVMAFLGVGMWVAFNSTFQKTSHKVDDKVTTCIGESSDNPNC